MGTDFDDESIDYRKADANRPIVLIIGNEGKGMSQGVKKQCDYKLHLPMKGSVQSLNASVAAGILLYDLQSRRGSL
jgi:23S rRNA (guanosine2251-2'-O)-methyltransferase